MPKAKIRQEQIISSDGWNSSASMVYASSDAPSYTVTMSGDQSGTYQAGQKIKLTHNSSTKYFIVTKVETSGSTALTLYGGTDYVLSGSPITNPYYSLMKAPFGFPLDPAKWTVEISHSDSHLQNTPTDGIWYNPGSINISIPIGMWNVSYYATIECIKNSSTYVAALSTLSTANNSESDSDFTASYEINLQTVTNLYGGNVSINRSKSLLIAAKILYYLNIKTWISSATSIGFRGDSGKTIIRAVCAYL